MKGKVKLETKTNAPFFLFIYLKMETQNSSFKYWCNLRQEVSLHQTGENITVPGFVAGEKVSSVETIFTGKKSAIFVVVD